MAINIALKNSIVRVIFTDIIDGVNLKLRISRNVGLLGNRHRGPEEPAILISRFLIITHAWHVCSQHSFGLPLRMYGMRKIQSVFTHVAGIYANLFEQRKAFTKKKVQLPRDWFGTPI